MQQTYIILRIAVALVLPSGNAYCEDAVMSDGPTGWASALSTNCTASRAPLADGGALHADATSSSLMLSHDGRGSEILPQKGETSALSSTSVWRSRPDLLRRVQDASRYPQVIGTSGYPMHMRPKVYSGAFDTISRVFRQVALIAQGIKGDVNESVAPLAASLRSGLAIGMHTPSPDDVEMGIKSSGIFTEKSAAAPVPYLSVTLVFGS